MNIKHWEKIFLLCKKITYGKKEKNVLELGKELFSLIDKHELKYGKSSESLATRADYSLILAPYYSLRLLKEAYKLADSKKDFEELVFITSSIASIYIDDLAQKKESLLWLRRMEKALDRHPNKVEKHTFISLKRKVKKLRP